jgi:hypothetical protein
MNSRKDVKSSPGQIILNISDNEGSLWGQCEDIAREAQWGK